MSLPWMQLLFFFDFVVLDVIWLSIWYSRAVAEQSLCARLRWVAMAGFWRFWRTVSRFLSRVSICSFEMRLQDSVAEWADLDSSIIWNALWMGDGNVQTNTETNLMNVHPGNFIIDMSSVWSPGVLGCADVCARLRGSRAFLSLLYSLDALLWTKSIELKGSKQKVNTLNLSKISGWLRIKRV